MAQNPFVPHISPQVELPENGERPVWLSVLETDTATSGVIAARSLVTIRWVAIVGQTISLLVAAWGFRADVNLVACLATVMAAVVLNVAASIHRRMRPRLDAHEAALYLAFDILQLSLLLYLTGGLDNPFSMFLIAPAAVSAGLLTFSAVATLTVLTVMCLTLNATWHLPLPWPDGAIELPDRYAWAVWLALTLAISFIAAYSWSIARETRRMRSALNATQMELAKANQMTAMGALAAAVAHELGTPLATISLVSKELLRDLSGEESELRDDVELLVSQAERCRRVLADFAQRPAAEGGDPYRVLPLPALVEEAAGPHRVQGVGLNVAADVAGGAMLMVRRRPELIHGIGNFVQNAFQYAKTTVDIKVKWDGDKVTIIVADDGPGYPSGLLQKMGEPYISTRVHGHGGHMGLGVFIAKTLLERIGARVTFSNRAGGGAQVTIVWPRKAQIFEIGAPVLS